MPTVTYMTVAAVLIDENGGISVHAIPGAIREFPDVITVELSSDSAKCGLQSNFWRLPQTDISASLKDRSMWHLVTCKECLEKKNGDLQLGSVT